MHKLVDMTENHPWRTEYISISTRDAETCSVSAYLVEVVIFADKHFQLRLDV